LVTHWLDAKSPISTQPHGPAMKSAATTIRSEDSERIGASHADVNVAPGHRGIGML
jgi:hypothetical protein